MSNRLETILEEIRVNEETTKTVKAKRKTIEAELNALGDSVDPEQKEEAKKVREKLSAMDKQYNKLRSDWYMLMSYKRDEEAKS